MQSVLNLKSEPSNNRRIKERKKGALHPSARNSIQSEVLIHATWNNMIYYKTEERTTSPFTSHCRSDKHEKTPSLPLFQ